MNSAQENNDTQIEKKKKKDPLAREGLVPEWKQPEPYFEPSEGAAKKMARYGFNKPWRVIPDDKRELIHELANTQDALIYVHKNAIVIGSPQGGGGRKGFVFYVYFSGFMTLFFYFATFNFGIPNSYRTLFGERIYNENFISHAFIFSLLMLVSILFTFGSIFIFRTVYRTPPDWPIMFNRETRVVTFFKQMPLDLFKFWMPIVSPPISCSWDDAKVRVYRVFMSRFGKTFYYALWLQMLWGGKDGNPKRLKDYVAIGFEGYEEDDGLLQLWEHIRRYMEEDGPPIQPGERLRKPANKRKPLEFPPDIIAAAGGPALSEAEVLALAGLPTEQAAGA